MLRLRPLFLALALLVATTSLAACSSSKSATTSASPSSTPGATAEPAPKTKEASDIANIVQSLMKSQHLRAVIVKVTKDDQLVANQAFGQSMTGVPATTDMYFRNGAVAFEYLSNLLLQFVDEKKVKLDDTIEKWEPTLPEANKVTLKMLTNQTSGYPDFETDPQWLAAFNADPFHIWTYEERLKYAFSRPLQFPPGTNWSYAHTNFMILGDALAKIGGKPLNALLKEKVLDPMGLHHTAGTITAAIPEPVLHTFTAERRVPTDSTSYEEATFWNTQWGTPMGANETSNIDDMITTAVKIGTGALLSKESFEAMTKQQLLGFGKKQANCEPSCFKQIPIYNYALGVVRSGDWLVQDPLVSAQSATEAYYPPQKIAIAVVTTYDKEAFNAQGVEPNASDPIFRAIAKYMGYPTPSPPANG